jgi:hypothetical protein
VSTPVSVPATGVYPHRSGSRCSAQRSSIQLALSSATCCSCLSSGCTSNSGWVAFPYLAFYLICGLGVNAPEIATAVGSNVSDLGASGAIAGSGRLSGALSAEPRQDADSARDPGLDCAGTGLQSSISPTLCGVTTGSACPAATNRDGSLPVISPSSATSRCSSDSTKRSSVCSACAPLSGRFRRIN